MLYRSRDNTLIFLYNQDDDLDTLCTTIVLLSNQLVSGQVQIKGRYQPYGFLKSGSFHDIIVEGPKLDNDVLMKTALEQDRPDPLTHVGPQAPHKFAEAVDFQVDITDATRGTWIEDNANNRRTWRYNQIPGALSISLLFNDFVCYLEAVNSMSSVKMTH